MDIKTLRENLKLSQDAFASKLQVAPFSVRRWEAGGKISRLAKLQIQHVFKVKID